MPTYSYRLVSKIGLIVGFIIVGCVALLNFFFLDRLAASNVRQVWESARITSVIVSDLALGSFYSRDKTHIIDALDQVLAETGDQESSLLQISVILFPSGVYYASTNKEFRNKRAGQTLLKKIESYQQTQMISELLNYEVNNRSQTVLQFLRNIHISMDGEEKRIATVQVLYDYNRILKKARESLFIYGGVLLLFSLAVVGVLFLPLSAAFRRLYEGMEEIGNHHFGFSLPAAGSGDETGILFKAFNRMNASLQEFFKKEQHSQLELLRESQEEKPRSVQLLRKKEITCLCARIPGIQEVIEANSSVVIDEHINSFIGPLEKIAREYGGQIIKVLGDKTYTLFEGINSTDNAVRMALKVNLSWRMDNHERKVLNRKLRDYGIGLHSTAGIAGPISPASGSYTFVGEAAAVAEKLCSLSRMEEILISSSMLDKTSGEYLHQTVKGIPASELGITEDILSITPLPIDGAQAGATRTKSADGSDGFGVDSITGKTRSSFESSITDMLEETLITSPLDPLEDTSSDYGLNGGASPSGLTGNRLEEDTESLWEKFNTIKKSDED